MSVPLVDLTDRYELLVVCGAGGVGKTTVAATIAAAAASEQGRRVLVLTVDPARRLADALGVAELGYFERRVPLPYDTDATPGGELWAAMVDARTGWDDLVARHSPSPQVRDRLLANRLYRDVTGRFAHSHEYLAMERLHQVSVDADFDLVVVDTPPSTHAIDILDAPERMVDFFESRLLTWLTTSARSPVIGLASRPFYQVLDRVLGPRFGEDLAEMFGLLAELRPGFVARAGQVGDILRHPATGYVVVTTPEVSTVGEAERVVMALRSRQLSPAALVVNRSLPPDVDTADARLIRSAIDDGQALTELATALDIPSNELIVVLDHLADQVDDRVRRAERQARILERTDGWSPLRLHLPSLATDIGDVASLIDLGHTLWVGRSGRAD